MASFLRLQTSPFARRGRLLFASQRHLFSSGGCCLYSSSSAAFFFGESRSRSSRQQHGQRLQVHVRPPIMRFLSTYTVTDEDEEYDTDDGNDEEKMANLLLEAQNSSDDLEYETSPMIEDSSSSSSSSSSPSLLSALEQNLLAKKKDELKELCRQRGLKVGGVKSEIVQRLLDYSSKVFGEQGAVDMDLADDDNNNDGSLQVAQEAEHQNEKPSTNEYCFDKSDNYKLVHISTLQGREEKDMIQSPDLKVVDETDSLLDLLPPEYAAPLRENDEVRKHLMEVVLDIGRRPFAWVNGKRHFLSDEAIHPNMLNDALRDLKFGSDNRAGLNGCLHRISAVRNRDGDFVGATLRVGRYVPGNALMIADILLGSNDASVLFVGPPGSAKTSIIRDAARLLSENSSVVIVDTSNEIGGAGDIPHHCIGFSRRMQVPTLDRQAAVMVECVQNHTPECIVIDEIGRPEEVKAALTCKERGVRIIASAHGDLPGLVRNTALCDLVGGVDVVTVGDRTAKMDALLRKNGSKIASKLRAERRGPPIFDVIIELERNRLSEWHIVLNTATAVDSILRSGEYESQIRSRGDKLGPLQVRTAFHDINRNQIIEEQLNNSERERAMTKSSFDMTEPGHTSHCTPYSDKQCPCCGRKFKKRLDMLQHVLKKYSCRSMLAYDSIECFEDELLTMRQ